MWAVLIYDFFMLWFLMDMRVSMQSAVLMRRTHINIVTQVRRFLITCIYRIFDPKRSLKINGNVSYMVIFTVFVKLFFVVVNLGLHFDPILLPQRWRLFIECWRLNVFFWIVFLLQFLYYVRVCELIFLKHEIFLQSHAFELLFGRSIWRMRETKTIIARSSIK